MKEFFTENLGTIIAIVGTLFASFGIIGAALKKFKKELMDVVEYRKIAMEDGKLDEQEMLQLNKELGEAIEAGTKLWYLVVGIFKKAKKKKK